MTRAVKKTQWGQARARSHAVQLPGTHLERLWDCSPGASTAGDGRTAPRLAEMMCSFCVKSAPQLESSRGNFHFKTVLTKISSVCSLFWKYLPGRVDRWIIFMLLKKTSNHSSSFLASFLFFESGYNKCRALATHTENSWECAHAHEICPWPCPLGRARTGILIL